MTHTIIYDNRTGYRFYESSPDFPEQYKQDIATICSRFTCGKTSASALRYAPLGEYYLLSVVFRCPHGSKFHDRSLYIVVNFLMDDADANDFFSWPFSAAYDAVILYAAQLYANYAKAQIPLPTGLHMETWQDLLVSSAQNTPDFLTKFQELTYLDLIAWKQKHHDVLYGHPLYPTKVNPADTAMSLDWLLASVLYNKKNQITHQIYVGINSPVAREIQLLQEALPVTLRKLMTFHTDLLSDKASHGITLNFCTVNQLDTIKSLDYQEGPGTNKHTFFARTGTKAVKESTIIETHIHPQCEQIANVISRVSPGIYQLVVKGITSRDDFMKLAGLENNDMMLMQLLSIIPTKRRSEIMATMTLNEEEAAELNQALSQLSSASHSHTQGNATTSDCPYLTKPTKTRKAPKHKAPKHIRAGRPTSPDTVYHSFPYHKLGAGISSLLMAVTGLLGLLCLLIFKYSITTSYTPEKLVVEVSAAAAASLLETLVTMFCTVLLTLGISRLLRQLKKPH